MGGLWGTERPAAALALWLAHVLHGDIVSQITQALLSFLGSIWTGISNFFGTIFQAIANTIASIFNAPAQAIQSSFTSLSNFANGFGPLAPLITIGIVAVVFLLTAWLIWTIIKLSVSEGEQTAEEAEEGV